MSVAGTGIKSPKCIIDLGVKCTTIFISKKKKK